MSLSSKIAICGMGSVGKSALVIQFLQQRFVSDYDPTIEELYRKQLGVDNEAVMLEILDTAGQEEYTSMLSHYLDKGEGYIIAYSIINRDSFNKAGEYFDLIAKIKESDEKYTGSGKFSIKNIPIVLVGNKCDLDGERKVTYKEAEKFAKKNNCPFFETSAKENINVKDAFFEIVREIRRSSGNKKNTQKKKRCTIL
ncbi:ras [Anaeramoeba flamelloides]|uniref:Ras n=1 Tax=Anaeramoeba flamelloides TaxID=1746091 RepID=A0AAV7YKR5_9EUKA|nr:ras di-ras and rheb family members of small gtpase superfamily [Anaeramoeba flamelloides]KAJ6239218.1 ras [Anaeramoeba flamelloides]